MHKPAAKREQGRKPPIVEIKGENGDEVTPPPPEVIEPDPALSPEEAEQVRKDYLLTRFWISARGFWGRNGDRLAWLYSIGLVVLIVLTVGFQYGINVWNRAIFDAIEKREATTVFHLTAVFFPLAIGSIVLGVAQVFARMGIQRRWRAWLTASVLTRWLANGRYYQLNLVGGDHKNPEYRIAEDLRVATDSPVDFLAGVTSALLSAATFIIVLWTIGGALTVTLGGSAITIPGFLVIAAILYAAIASGSILVIGRRFVQVSEDKNQAEADFRYTLTRVRENGESIALLGGEEEERGGIDRNFTNVLRQWARLAGQHMRTTLVSQGSSLVAPVVPLLLCAPKFLDGSMTLGQVMQAASAFTIVQSAFGWLVDNYPRLADWNACARRIASLMMSLDGLERAEQGDGLGRIKRGETSNDAMLEMKDLSVTLDDGTAVVGEDRGGDRAGRAAAGRGRIRHRQEHAGARHRGALAMGRRQRQFPSRPAPVHAAAAALRAVRQPAPRRRLSRRRGRLDRGGDRRSPAQGRPRPPQGEDRGRGTVGSDVVRRREAAPRLRAAAAAQSRHRRAR
ncbi:ABC-type uncharacterized transport system fused permease/ATPase subunit [Bradyrhizobium sp. S3.14.4]